MVTREYLLPIRTWLAGKFPAPGALWVLGCESLTTAQLEAFMHGICDHCEIILRFKRRLVILLARLTGRGLQSSQSTKAATRRCPFVTSALSSNFSSAAWIDSNEKS